MDRGVRETVRNTLANLRAKFDFTQGQMYDLLFILCTGATVFSATFFFYVAPIDGNLHPVWAIAKIMLGISMTGVLAIAALLMWERTLLHHARGGE